jgi:hypothetical protein
MSASSLISQLNGLSLGSPSFLSGAQRFPSASSSRAFRPAYAPLNIEAAHKKGTGSTKNGRDSNSKSRGVKVYGDQYAKAGSIIIRQCGTHVSVEHTIRSTFARTMALSALFLNDLARITRDSKYCFAFVYIWTFIAL